MPVVRSPSEKRVPSFSKLAVCLSLTVWPFYSTGGIVLWLVNPVRNFYATSDSMGNYIWRPPDTSFFRCSKNMKCVITKENFQALLLKILHLQYYYSKCTIFWVFGQVSEPLNTLPNQRYGPWKSCYRVLRRKSRQNFLNRFCTKLFWKPAQTHSAIKRLSTQQQSVAVRSISIVLESMLQVSLCGLVSVTAWFAWCQLYPRR